MNKIILVVLSLLILVGCTSTVVEIETIEAQVEYIDDETMYKGEEIVEMEAVNGEKEVKYKITSKDGDEESREIVEEKIIKEAINGITRRGTKIKLANRHYNTEFDCGNNTLVYLDDEKFIYGLRESDAAHFGTYEPVESHTYKATVIWGGSPGNIDEQNPLEYYFTIKEDKLYMPYEDINTLEDMNNRSDDNYTCIIK